jgi:hypothetical protein
MADAGIVRNRAKIDATINNARVWLEIAAEHGSSTPGSPTPCRSLRPASRPMLPMATSLPGPRSPTRCRPT